MKKLMAIAMAVATMVATFTCRANEPSEIRHDTLTVYRSWQSIFNGRCDTLVVDPNVNVRTPFDFEFSSSAKNDKATNQLLRDSTVAVAIGDSTWLINSNWIKRNFKGDCQHFSRYVPLYFSAKVAFVQFLRGEPSVGSTVFNVLVAGLTGVDPGVGQDDVWQGQAAPFYHLNFATHEVHHVTSDYLTQLLEPYPDLKRRYLMMRDYDQTYMINDYFMEYVDRLNDDPSVPLLF